VSVVLRPPQPHPFLTARDVADPDAVVWGLPVDGGVSFRPGAAEGPSGVRRFSESIESYSPRTGRDLDGIRLVDLGDHPGPPHEAAEAVLGAVWDEGRRPLVATVGGDHSITPHVVQAVHARADGLAVVGFDAHLDLREDYPGDHACTYRRIAERGVPCVVLGPRSGARGEWTDAATILRFCSPELRLPPHVRSRMQDAEVYVTVDIDVLDPSAAPGTGNPEPGGPAFAELLEAIEALEGLNVVAFDVVEVSPPLDPSGITQAAGAVLLREMLLRFSSR
jgi:agmatinase